MNVFGWLGLGAAVFLAALAYDWANARYVTSAAAGLPGRAALWSATVALFGIVGLLGVIKVSPWLAIPEIAGFACGTYLGVGIVRQKP